MKQTKAKEVKIKKKRFNSEHSAKTFAKKVNGKVNDLREIQGSKSSFSVTYEGKGIDNREFENLAIDFDSDLNMNGMNWHTSEDL